MRASYKTRENMAASQLFTNEVVDKRILQAMLEVARENYVPEALRHCAYVDEALDVGNGRYQMAPLTFAKLLELAEITPECRVLTVGALSGYSAAVLARLAGDVTAIETDPVMVEEARMMRLLNVKIQQVKSLADGYPAAAPYDIIFIEGAVEALPDALGEQLSLSGRLMMVKNIEKRPGIVGGVGRGGIVRRVNNQLQFRPHFDAAGAVLPGFEHPAQFVF